MEYNVKETSRKQNEAKKYFFKAENRNKKKIKKKNQFKRMYCTIIEVPDKRFFFNGGKKKGKTGMRKSP